jgi:hypothetical protein
VPGFAKLLPVAGSLTGHATMGQPERDMFSLDATRLPGPRRSERPLLGWYLGFVLLAITGLLSAAAVPATVYGQIPQPHLVATSVEGREAASVFALPPLDGVREGLAGHGDEHPGHPVASRYLSERPGLRDAVVYTTAWHVVGMGLLLSLDPEATGFEPPHIRNVVRAVTSPPVWDDDEWFTNYIGHPLWGSETYLAVRRDGYSRWESFLFSTAASVVWEVAIEGWAEQPSIQDLLLTSTVGSLLGEVRYRMIASLAQQDGTWAKVALVVVDPLRNLTNLTGLQVGVGVALRPH